MQLYTTPEGQIRHRERLGGNNMGFTPRLKGRTPPDLIDYLLSAPPLGRPPRKSEFQFNVGGEGF